MNTQDEIAKEDWLRRCAQRFIEKGGLDEDTAMAFAEACWDAYDRDIDAPESAADEDMSYWENDQ